VKLRSFGPLATAAFASAFVANTPSLAQKVYIPSTVEFCGGPGCAAVGNVAVIDRVTNAVAPSSPSTMVPMAWR
jgi:hypothetical protein